MDWYFILLIVIASILVLCLLVYFAIGYGFFRFAFKKKPWVVLGADVTGCTLFHIPEYDDVNKYEVYEVKAFDGLTLRGYFLKAKEPSNKYVIFFHGYRSRPLFDFSSCIKKAHEEGYNCLAIAERACDPSDGKSFTMGDKEAKDAHSWVNLLISKDKEAEIVLFGRSMGAHTVMLSFRELYPSNVKGFIEDSGYACLKEEFDFAAQYYHVPLAKFIVNVGLSYLGLVKHCRPNNDVRPILSSLKVPGLYLQGENDLFVPFSNLDKVYGAALDGYKERVSFPGAGHVSSETKDEKRFDEAVNSFYRRTLK